MNQFYVNANLQFSYSELVEKVNNTTFFYSNHVAKDFIDFITNVICGLVNSKDVVLNDFSEFGGQEMGEEIQNHFQSKSELINAVVHSEANIGVYSSGSEGPAKLIFQPISRLMKSVKQEEQYKSTSWGFTYNPTHSAGMQVFLQAFTNEATLVGMQKTKRDDITRLIKEKKLNYLSATPTFYRMLAPFDFVAETVKSVTLNGEKSTMVLIEQVKKVFPNARIRNIYGSTEVGPLMSSETDTFVVPERLKNAVKVSEAELFFHQSIVSKSIPNQEWYPSGDLVEIVTDEPLTVKFVSRKSRILNVAGENVNPQHIEEALQEISGIQDARVWGKPHPLIGNLLVAEVQKLNGSEITEKDIMDELKKKLPSFKVPRIITFVDSTSVGRTGKKQL